ncbi:MAG: TAXI family TRAP transporter solute-binding subunit [Alphaproteobacteria bacterium]|nr:TAXI family TRAP transporter solute-binding subunit [Alphaproteobacteria bacterium]MCB9930750.1 TAXI family TRAP transporter solute-binding subunit [Alphaproteobacteria bacterium]
MLRHLSLTAALAGALALPAAAAVAADPVLPKTMVWSSYDLGSSGHAEATGIANALRKNYGTRIRIVPSGTSIGRMLPMVTGKVKYGFLGNEAYFSTEGLYDYASEQWGPQNLRTIMGRVATTGLAVAADTGVKNIADLKGLRIGYVKGNPSVNAKTDAALAFGGLTRDDVQPVWFGSYGAMKTALLANQLDAFGSVTTAANVREIEASPRGLVFPGFPPENTAGWKAVTDVISFAGPSLETKGAGVSEEHPKWLLGYRYPIMSVYEKAASADEVYNLVKAIDLSFDDFKHTTASSFNWALEQAGRPPYDSPTHEGTIRYMKEKGLWRPEDQAWQEKRLARLDKVIAAWDEAQAEFTAWRVAEKAKGNKVDPDTAWPEYWEKARMEKLK